MIEREGQSSQTEAASKIRVRVIFKTDVCVMNLLVWIALAGCTRSVNEEDTMRQLEALPYLGGRSAPEETLDSGTRIFRRGLASEGLNLFKVTPEPNKEPRGEAWLVDMDGVKVHQWSSSAGQLERSERLAPWLSGWDHVEFSSDGFLYAIVFGKCILKLDWDSRVLWETLVAAHHDLAIAADGSVYTIADRVRHVKEGPILDNEIAKLSSSGAVEWYRSLYDILSSSESTRQILQEGIKKRLSGSIERLVGESASRRARFIASVDAGGKKPAELDENVAARMENTMKRALEITGERDDPLKPDWINRGILANTFMDVFHANTIELLARGVEGIWDEGDFLVSVRHLDLVVVVDARDSRVKWAWGPGELSRQHQPTLLRGGNLLVYDNGNEHERTRLLGVKPFLS